jgi:hypothetical protein
MESVAFAAPVSKRAGSDLDSCHTAAPDLSNKAVSRAVVEGSAVGNSFTAPSAALSIDASTYHTQLDAKLGKLKSLFMDHQIPSIEVCNLSKYLLIHFRSFLLFKPASLTASTPLLSVACVSIELDGNKVGCALIILFSGLHLCP